MSSLKIGLAQINPTMGDFKANKIKMLKNIQKAKDLNLDILVFPECVITGYPPEDLLFKKSFIDENIQILDEISKNVKDMTVVLGFIDRKDSKLYNALAVVEDGKIKHKYYKRQLPNYGVFDEKRYFSEGQKPLIIDIKNIKFAMTICEDIWNTNSILSGTDEAEVILNISASPYDFKKEYLRNKTVYNYIKDSKSNKLIFYCNLVGGQDELVFDGNSFVMDKNSNILAQAKSFEEDVLVFVIPNECGESKCRDTKFCVSTKEKTNITEIHKALVLGTHDYIAKNGFKKVLIGLSGGIDSALVAKIAVDAFGKDKVVCVSLPSRYSSNETRNDAKILAENLGVEFHEIVIEELHAVYLNLFSDIFKDLPKDTTEENIQARIRGNILMAMSNKLGYLVLTTGNKSETAVGYCTLYGDMAGGFAVIKDIPKTMVFELSKMSPEIPETIITRPPSAELKPDQKDQDSLPEYEVLDAILELYIDKDYSLQEINQKLNIDTKIIEKVIKLVDRNEYKRRQTAIGIKITNKAFGKERRMPITNKFFHF